MPDVSSASELENNDRLPFLGMMIIRNSPRPDTKVYAKPTDTGILPPSAFFSTLNEIHPSLIFTMELNDAHYVVFTSRHFHQGGEEHKRSKPGNHGKDP
ncbi:hypothetical protein pdam_00020514 [Pocillopora damicornis]|uniref:Uncharacterized protein n=1 Tax=Pocillopora damicornis TaxID=46731 RepID=A0A3M6TYN6_POCDA|nr:hypothetical protein pdam_00020514 [Pocillopora damicornis]